MKGTYGYKTMNVIQNKFFFSLSYKIEHPGNYKKVNLKELHALKKLVRLISYVDTKHEASQMKI